MSFRHIPKAHIRRLLLEHNSFYAPTHFAIADNERRVKEEMALVPPGMPVFFSSIFRAIPGYAFLRIGFTFGFPLEFKVAFFHSFSPRDLIHGSRS